MTLSWYAGSVQRHTAGGTGAITPASRGHAGQRDSIGAPRPGDQRASGALRKTRQLAGPGRHEPCAERGALPVGAPQMPHARGAARGGGASTPHGGISTRIPGVLDLIDRKSMAWNAISI